MKTVKLNLRRRRVNRELLSQAETVLRNWLNGEVRGRQFVALNPLRDDKSLGSFSINLFNGVWKDFAVDSFSGPDLVSLYMALQHLGETAALDALEAYLSKPWAMQRSAPKKGGRSR